MHANIWRTLGASVLISIVSNSAIAQHVDFRITTDVFVEGQKEPVSQTKTIFMDGVAYDFPMGSNPEITLIDPDHGRIMLLDTEKQLHTEISLQDLLNSVQRMRSQATGGKLAIFVQDAEVTLKKLDANRITVGKNVIQYDATLAKPNEDADAANIARQFRYFADPSACLNAWQRQSPPPFARLNLNEEIEKAAAIPENITRITKTSDQEVVVKCIIHSNWILPADDKAEVKKVGQMLASYTQVTPAEYERRHAAALPGAPVKR